MGLDSAKEEAGAEQAAVSCKPVANQVPQKRFRGVTKHRRSGRWEAHIWVREMGRQVYLGGYEHAEHAAEAYDVAALKCKGFKVKTNFDIGRYSNLTESMDSITLEEVIMAVRRQSRGFSRGTSAYRGVTHHPSGRWEARIGIPAKVYLGLFSMETEAAQAYDRALVRLRGTAAATNFALSDYRSDLAAYHKMQQAVLQSDKGMGSPPGNSLNFERWIKHGLMAEDLQDINNQAQELLSHSQDAGPVAALTSTAVRKRLRVQSRSRSRSRSPCGKGGVEQSGHRHGMMDGDSDHNSGPQQVRGCILADLAQHLLKAYDGEEEMETQSQGTSQAEHRFGDSAAHLGPHSSDRQPATTGLGQASAVARQEVPQAAAAAAAAPRGDLACEASEEISTCSEMQSSGCDGVDTQSDNSMHGHSTVGADTAEVESKPESNSLMKKFHQQLSSQEQELQIARAQVVSVQSDLAVSRSEVLQLRSQATHNTTAPQRASSDMQTPAACSAGQSQPDVPQQACFEDQQAQLDKLRAELTSANQRCNGYEVKLQTARAQYQEQQRRIVSLENVVYDLKLHASQSS